MGFEPTTTGITIRDSNQLSYAHHTQRSTSLDIITCYEAIRSIPKWRARQGEAGDKTKPRSLAMDGMYGAPGRNRTCDPQLRRLVLYPLSYGRMEKHPHITSQALPARN